MNNELIRNIEFVEGLTPVGRKDIKDYVIKLEQENKELKEYRQELRSWLQDEIIDSKAGGSQYYWFGRVLSKLNELEGKNE